MTSKSKVGEKEGIFKMINGAMEQIDPKVFIIKESWRKTKARLQEQYPTAKIKYSYRTGQFRILFDLPSDYHQISEIKLV